LFDDNSNIFKDYAKTVPATVVDIPDLANRTLLSLIDQHDSYTLLPPRSSSLLNIWF